VSHDTSEIIVICRFAARETFLIISVKNFDKSFLWLIVRKKNFYNNINAITVSFKHTHSGLIICWFVLFILCIYLSQIWRLLLKSIVCAVLCGNPVCSQWIALNYSIFSWLPREKMVIVPNNPQGPSHNACWGGEAHVAQPYVYKCINMQCIYWLTS